MNTVRTISLKSQTTKIFISSLFVAVTTLILLVTPAFAEAPGNGKVYEGQSVPGIELGATRAEVTESYGKELSCDLTSNDRDRKTYTCTYAAEGKGFVYVTFKRSFLIRPIPNYDTVTFIRWSQDVSGWETRAGVNTKLAFSDPKAVVEAYPDASVKFSNGNIIQVRDAKLGIQVDWQYSSFSDQSDQKPAYSVSMAIFFPESNAIGISR